MKAGINVNYQSIGSGGGLRPFEEIDGGALEHGQQQANDLDYVPLPPSLVQQIESYWASEFKG